ncbi:MAG: hypothetical protein RR460_04405 [Clostridium sp.]
MINFRTQEEITKYLYIEGINLDGSYVLIGQATFSYIQSTQANVTFNIFDDNIYNTNKDLIERKLTDFRLECEIELRNTDNVLFGSYRNQELIEVFDADGNRIGVMSAYKNDSVSTLPLE